MFLCAAGYNHGLGILPRAFSCVLFPGHASVYFSYVVEINLYQPGRVNDTIQFPSQWNEFNLQEIHIIAKTILSNFATAPQANASLFLNLLRMRSSKKFKGIEKHLDGEDIVINGYPAISFIYKENNLTRQPYPKIKLPGLSFRNYYGPADDFNSLTCGEFEDAEFFFNRFKIDQTAEHLAHLAAILYRPKNIFSNKIKKYHRLIKNTDSYETYDAEKIYLKFKKLKPWVLYSIFLWYAGCREQLPKIFPNCFGASKQETEETRDPDFLIFTKCIHAGAGPKNGTRNQIRCTLLKEFFLEIELQNIENIELQNKIDNAK